MSEPATLIEHTGDGKPWRDSYPVHPSADVFPMLTIAELDDLATDIKEHGLQQPAVLWRSSKTSTAYSVVDGRNRLDALARIGVDIPSDPSAAATLPDGRRVVIFTFLDANIGDAVDIDPAAFVVSANVHRRHLKQEQRAELIVRAVEAGGPNDRAKVARSFNTTAGRIGGSTKDPLLTAAVTVGKTHGISKRTIQRARARVRGKSAARRKNVDRVASERCTLVAPPPSPASAEWQPSAVPPHPAADPAGAREGCLRDVEDRLRVIAFWLRDVDRTALFHDIRQVLVDLDQEAQLRERPFFGAASRARADLVTVTASEQEDVNKTDNPALVERLG